MIRFAEDEVENLGQNQEKIEDLDFRRARSRRLGKRYRQTDTHYDSEHPRM